MELLGEANWWLPRWLDRLLPRLKVEGGAGAVSGRGRRPPRRPNPSSPVAEHNRAPPPSASRLTGRVASGLMVHAFVLIDAEPGRIAALAEELADVEGVAEVYSVAGEADVVAIVRVRHHEELADVVTRRITALDGIVNTRTLIAFQAFSRHDLEALWDLGPDG